MWCTLFFYKLCVSGKVVFIQVDSFFYCNPHGVASVFTCEMLVAFDEASAEILEKSAIILSGMGW